MGVSEQVRGAVGAAARADGDGVRTDRDIAAQEGERRLLWRFGNRAGALEDLLDVALEAVEEDVLDGKSRHKVDCRDRVEPLIDLLRMGACVVIEPGCVGLDDGANVGGKRRLVVGLDRLACAEPLDQIVHRSGLEAFEAG